MLETCNKKVALQFSIRVNLSFRSQISTLPIGLKIKLFAKLNMFCRSDILNRISISSLKDKFFIALKPIVGFVDLLEPDFYGTFFGILVIFKCDQEGKVLVFRKLLSTKSC